MQFNMGGGGSSGSSGGCSLVGILIGLLLIPAGFYMAYYGEMKLVNHGEVFESVVMMTPEKAATVDGDVVKFKGMPVAEPIEVDYYDKPVIYFDKRLEEYEREEDADGDVSYTWKTQRSTSKFVPFTIDQIRVQPGDAKVVGAREVFRGISSHSSATGGFDASVVDTHTPEVGDRRLTLEIIDTGQELIVFGRKKGDTVAGGSTFVVSALDELSTAAELKAEYRLFYWLLKGGAVLAITIGILLFLGPLTTIFGYVPLLGRSLNSAIGAAAFAFAIIAVLMVTVFLKLLWVLIALLVLGLIVAVIMAVRSPEQPPPKAAEAEAPPQPPAGPAEKDTVESAEDIETPSIPRPLEGDDGSDEGGE